MVDVAEQRQHVRFLGVLELFGLLNRQRGKCGNDREESEVVVRERPLAFVQHIQAADRLAIPACLAYPPYLFIPLVPRDKTRRLIDGVKVGRILVDLVGNTGLPGLEDGAGNAFAQAITVPRGTGLSPIE